MALCADITHWFDTASPEMKERLTKELIGVPVTFLGGPRVGHVGGVTACANGKVVIRVVPKEGLEDMLDLSNPYPGWILSDTLHVESVFIPLKGMEGG
jgi:hypothetical protein